MSRIEDPESLEADLATSLVGRVGRRDEERRERFEKLLAGVLGEEELRAITSLDPLRVIRSSPQGPPDSPFSRTIAAKEFSATDLIQRAIEADAEGRLGHLPRMRRYHQLHFPPYDPAGTEDKLVDGTTTHGGHAATDQLAYGNPEAGTLGIWTVIDDDSSNGESIGFLDVTLRPVYSRGSLIVTPFLTYDAYHYLAAAGGGGAHSDGSIGMVLMSSAPDGSDQVEEDRQEQNVWDVRVQGFSSTGTQDLNKPADEQGMVDAMLRLSTAVQQGRTYTVRPYIKSHADADGRHTFYASQAFVSYHAKLHWLQIEEEW